MQCQIDKNKTKQKTTPKQERAGKHKSTEEQKADKNWKIIKFKK